MHSSSWSVHALIILQMALLLVFDSWKPTAIPYSVREQFMAIPASPLAFDVTPAPGFNELAETLISRFNISCDVVLQALLLIYKLRTIDGILKLDDGKVYGWDIFLVALSISYKGAPFSFNAERSGIITMQMFMVVSIIKKAGREHSIFLQNNSLFCRLGFWNS